LRYFLELSYKGTHYHGWQTQPNAVSIQESIEKALSTLLGFPTSIMGAGRTDAGVHAKQMFAHFDSNNVVDTQQLTYRLNRFLPADIAIHNIHQVQPDAHARFDAIARSYTYRVHTKKNPFLQETSWYYAKELDFEMMNKAAKALLFFEDFQSFSKTHTDVKTYICDISEAYWEQNGSEWHFHITANRFLRNMVRAIVGTLIEIGLHKISIDELVQIIEAKDRSKAGFSVPAHGLYLTKIVYPNQIFI